MGYSSSAALGLPSLASASASSNSNGNVPSATGVAEKIPSIAASTPVPRASHFSLPALRAIHPARFNASSA